MGWDSGQAALCEAGGKEGSAKDGWTLAADRSGLKLAFFGFPKYTRSETNGQCSAVAVVRRNYEKRRWHS